MTKKRAIKLLMSFGYSREPARSWISRYRLVLTHAEIAQAAYERAKFELCRDIPCRQARNMRLCKLPAN